MRGAFSFAQGVSASLSGANPKSEQVPTRNLSAQIVIIDSARTTAQQIPVSGKTMPGVLLAC